jgi:steroid delta-isomerase-like uncharacterized protein
MTERDFPKMIYLEMPVSTMQSPSVLHRIFDTAFNQGNMTIIDELVSHDSVTHTTNWGMSAGRIGLKQLIAILRTAFPDLHCTVEDEIIQGDKVAAHLTMRGTHKGLFLGNSPTNKPFVVQGLIYTRIENEQVMESWIIVDQMGVLQQLGLVPPPRWDR